VYIEASGKRPGSKAWLVSQAFRSTTGRCINFWYNMYGQATDTLTVYVNVPGK